MMLSSACVSAEILKREHLGPKMERSRCGRVILNSVEEDLEGHSNGIKESRSGLSASLNQTVGIHTLTSGKTLKEY